MNKFVLQSSSSFLMSLEGYPDISILSGKDEPISLLFPCITKTFNLISYERDYYRSERNNEVNLNITLVQRGENWPRFNFRLSLYKNYSDNGSNLLQAVIRGDQENYPVNFYDYDIKIITELQNIFYKWINSMALTVARIVPDVMRQGLDKAAGRPFQAHPSNPLERMVREYADLKSPEDYSVKRRKLSSSKSPKSR